MYPYVYSTVIIVTDESTEDALVEALVGFDLQKAMDVLVTDVLAEGDVETAKILQSVFSRLAATFDDPEDVNAIMSLFSGYFMIKVFSDTRLFKIIHKKLFL